MPEINRKNSLSLALFASVFKVSLGLISYPLFLKFLDSFDLSIYLLFISTIAFVELLDLNFAANLVRYFSYAAAGVKTLDLNENSSSEQTDLLSDLFIMARQYYRYMCAIAFVIFGIGFSIYLYYFTALHHKNFIYYELNWLGYMSAMLLGIYFTYLSPALIGSGHIDRVNRVLLISKLTAVIIQSCLVYFIGLFAIVLGALVSMIIERVLLLTLVNKKLDFEKNKKIDKSKFYKLLKQFWGTNYKLALMSIAVTVLVRFKLFAAGFVIYDASKLAQFLFSLQVFTIAYTLATVPLSNNYSDMSAYFINDKPRLLKVFLKQNKIALFIISAASIFIILSGDLLVQILKVKHPFLPWPYLFIIALIFILEIQLNNHANSLIIQNKVNMYKSYLVSAAGTIILIILFCFILRLQIWGLLLAQLIMQSLNNYWYWVKCNLRSYSLSVKDYMKSLVLG
ncbi:MAG: hypothetical protein K0R14_1799 [Burkholderiales bacterium]|jgi:hypothetical protein|nr:hypothetical protein [Burkholderiales bacterium]